MWPKFVVHFILQVEEKSSLNIAPNKDHDILNTMGFGGKPIIYPQTPTLATAPKLTAAIGPNSPQIIDYGSWGSPKQGAPIKPMVSYDTMLHYTMPKYAILNRIYIEPGAHINPMILYDIVLCYNLR